MASILTSQRRILTCLLPLTVRANAGASAAARCSLTTESEISGQCLADSTSTMDVTMSEPRKRRIFDSHAHVWSAPGDAAYPWVKPETVPGDLVSAPDSELVEGSYVATYEAFRAVAAQAGVRGVLIVQPVVHLHDHRYVDATLKSTSTAASGDFQYRGMCLANPALKIGDAERDLEEKAAAGYVGVRFNPALFPDDDGKGPLASASARALYKKSGHLGLPVGVMTFTGILPHIPHLTSLLTEFPDTKLIIDHFGFFRQPATGGFAEADAAALSAKELMQKAPWLGESQSQSPSLAAGAESNSSSVSDPDSDLSTWAAPALSEKNDEDAFQAVLQLSRFPQVFVKLSALFRVSKQPFPHLDVRPRVLALLRSFGADRLMWGSDFPFVVLGGHAKNDFAVRYAETITIFDRWNAQAMGREGGKAHVIAEGDIDKMLGETAARLFKF